MKVYSQKLVQEFEKMVEMNYQSLPILHKITALNILFNIRSDKLSLIKTIVEDLNQEFERSSNLPSSYLDKLIYQIYSIQYDYEGKLDLSKYPALEKLKNSTSSRDRHFQHLHTKVSKYE